MNAALTFQIGLNDYARVIGEIFTFATDLEKLNRTDIASFYLFISRQYTPFVRNEWN